MFFLIPRYIHSVSFLPAWSRYLGGSGTRGIPWQKEELLKDSGWLCKNEIPPLFWKHPENEQVYCVKGETGEGKVLSLRQENRVSASSEKRQGVMPW